MEEIFGYFNNLIKNFNNGDSLFFAIDDKHRQFGSTTSKTIFKRLYKNARLFGLNKMDATNFALNWANSLFV